jgi:hypothetical protein
VIETKGGEQRLAARCVIRRCGHRATGVLDLMDCGGQYEITLLVCARHEREYGGWLHRDLAARLAREASISPDERGARAPLNPASQAISRMHP